MICFHRELVWSRLFVTTLIRDEPFSFTLTLPPATSDVLDQASRYSGVTHLAEVYDITALIADDTKVNREVLSRMLTDIGAEVMEAENGQQAVEMFRSHQPDIIFMDIRMPATDGIHVQSHISISRDFFLRGFLSSRAYQPPAFF